MMPKLRDLENSGGRKKSTLADLDLDPGLSGDSEADSGEGELRTARKLRRGAVGGLDGEEDLRRGRGSGAAAGVAGGGEPARWRRGRRPAAAGSGAGAHGPRRRL